MAGPWVVAPASQRVPRPHVEYQLSCPPGYIVGGLDAELSDRAIEIRFFGKLGSPVNPGITTGRTAVFDAIFTGVASAAASFRPHLGCVPTTGGGQGPVPYKAAGAAPSAPFPPGQPTVRRVLTLTLRTGLRQTVARACATGERLVYGWHAVGFATARPPSADLVASVNATQTIRAGQVLVVVRTGAALGGVRALVQVGAVCAGGS